MYISTHAPHENKSYNFIFFHGFYYYLYLIYVFPCFCGFIMFRNASFILKYTFISLRKQMHQPQVSVMLFFPFKGDSTGSSSICLRGIIEGHGLYPELSTYDLGEQ